MIVPYWYLIYDKRSDRSMLICFYYQWAMEQNVEINEFQIQTNSFLFTYHEFKER